MESTGNDLIKVGSDLIWFLSIRFSANSGSNRYVYTPKYHFWINSIWSTSSLKLFNLEKLFSSRFGTDRECWSSTRENGFKIYNERKPLFFLFSAHNSWSTIAQITLTDYIYIYFFFGNGRRRGREKIIPWPLKNDLASYARGTERCQLELF